MVWLVPQDPPRLTCGGCGFVYLKQHGVDKSVIEGVLGASRTFFDLPQEDKDRLASTQEARSGDGKGGSGHGYVRPGQEMLDELKEGGGKVVSHQSSFFTGH